MPTRRGLLIGIDAYIPPKVPKLDGCVNDSELVRMLLVDQFGFPESNLTLLRDGAATRVAILAALDALVEATGKDDLVVIQYAGHGSQMQGDPRLSPNGLLNTIMPVDSAGWSGDNRDISDLEIHARLRKLAEKTPYTTLLVDACHSATITRDAFGEKARFCPPDERPWKGLSSLPIPDPSTIESRGRSPSGWFPLGDHYVLVAGCRDEEVSFEYRPPEHKGKVAHGALTWFLTNELRRAAPGMTWRDVFERAAANVTANNARQHPQIEGRLDREVFGVTDFSPMRFLRVTARKGKDVTLGAGAALGLTAGSRFAVYAQGAKHATADDALGDIEITAVRAGTADARIVHERAPESISAGTRAVETEHDYGDMRMAVRIRDDANDAATANAMRQAIDASPLLRATSGDEAAAACVSLLPVRRDVRDGPVPQLPTLAAPTWAIVGQDGRLIAPAKAATDRDAVLESLEKIASYRLALALDNPDPRSALRDKVGLELLRKASDGSWVVAQPDAGGNVVYEEDDAIAWRVKNRHSTALHVNLLDFGLGLGIDRLFPERGATDKVDANFSFDIGTKPGDPEFTLGFPDKYPYGGEGGVTEGVEAFKLVLTTHEADFTFLEQEGVRSAGARGPDSPVMLLMRTAMGDTTTREAKKKVPLDAEDWGTVTRTITLRRRPRT